MKKNAGHRVRSRAVQFAIIAMSSGVLFAQRQPEDDNGGQWVETQMEVAVQDGYFPTAVDIEYLPGSDERRWGQSRHQGADQWLERATGTFPYPRNDVTFYEYHRDSFRPVNRVLNFLTPHDPLLVDFPGLNSGAVTADVRLPIFTREFEPDLAHLKLGPVYFDLLWVGAGVLWTDYSPVGTTRPIDEDDAAAYIDFAIRSYVRITDTIYFSMVGNFIYLPLENDLAVRAIAGTRSGAFARFEWQERVDTWDLLFMDTLRLSPGDDFFADIDEEGIDRAGRYRFGYSDPDDSARFDFDEDELWVSNRVDVRASSLIFNEDWRLWLEADHTDFWRSFDFDDHQYRDHLGILLGYEGLLIPFAPRLSYDVTTFDYDTFRHQAYLRFTGRITENIRTGFGGGYLWTTGDGSDRENWIWDVSLYHHLTEGIGHGVAVGQNAFDDEYTPESVWTTYAKYTIHAKIVDWISVAGFAQWEESERLQRRTSDRDSFDVDDYERYSFGAVLSLRPFDYTNITARVVYMNTEVPNGGRDRERWRYRLNVTQRLASRLTLEGYYQYEEARYGTGGFDEHVVGIGIKRYF